MYELRLRIGWKRIVWKVIVPYVKHTSAFHICLESWLLHLSEYYPCRSTRDCDSWGWSCEDSTYCINSKPKCILWCIGADRSCAYPILLIDISIRSKVKWIQEGYLACKSEYLVLKELTYVIPWKIIWNRGSAGLESTPHVRITTHSFLAYGGIGRTHIIYVIKSYFLTWKGACSGY
jgi:hypothetical protein